MAFFGGLLIFIGLVGLIVGLVTLVKPIERVRVTNRKRAVCVLGASLALMIVGGLITPTSDDDNPARAEAGKTASVTNTSEPIEEPKATNTPKSTNTPKPTETPRPTSTPAPPTATPEPAGFSFGSGKKQVGSEVSYATYRTRSASPSCYWERLKGLGGTVGEIIANENTNGPAVVTIGSSDVAFNSTRCARWTQDLSAITSGPDAPFGDGTFIVGVDINPGLWKSTGGTSCYWARLRDFSGGVSNIIANENTGASGLVQIAPGDKGFLSSRCGTWNRQ
ncbi:MAG: hypothetical protein ABIP13_06990 [Tepidiformaceae bacterium]